MKDLVIAADSSFGLDIKKIILSINENRKRRGMEQLYRIKGYIIPKEVDAGIELRPLLGYIDSWKPEGSEYLVIGIVDPCRKKAVVESLKGKGGIFETLRAPWTMAHLDMTFPEGCIIAAQSIMDSAKIGRFVTLFHTMVGFDANVEDYASVMGFANITTSHIEKKAFIGDNSVVIRKTVQEGATVKPNSVVVKDVKAGTTVMGNPARKIK